jgi:hypothetical protein
MSTNPYRFTENDVRRAVRSAIKEKLLVSGVEIERDGTIRVLTLPPVTEPAPASSPGASV